MIQELELELTKEGQAPQTDSVNRSQQNLQHGKTLNRHKNWPTTADKSGKICCSKEVDKQAVIGIKCQAQE